MRRITRRCSLAGVFISAAMLLAAGCGGEGKTIKVAGVVTLDGKPLSGATVTFIPVGEGRAASGMTDADGNFRLTTFRTEDGALAGEYKVTVAVTEADKRFEGKEDSEAMQKAEKMAMMKKMSSKGTQANPPSPVSPVSPVPALYGDVNRTPLKEVVPPPGKVELALRSNWR